MKESLKEFGGVKPQGHFEEEFDEEIERIKKESMEKYEEEMKMQEESKSGANVIGRAYNAPEPAVQAFSGQAISLGGASGAGSESPYLEIKQEDDPELYESILFSIESVTNQYELQFHHCGSEWAAIRARTRQR